MTLVEQPHRLPPVPRLGHDLELGPHDRQLATQRIAQQRFIVRDQRRADKGDRYEARHHIPVAMALPTGERESTECARSAQSGESYIHALHGQPHCKR